MNWPLTWISNATVQTVLAHTQRPCIQFLLFCYKSQETSTLYFIGNMQSPIVLIQCMVLHVTNLACTCVQASRVWQLASIYWQCTFVYNPQLLEETSTFSTAVVAWMWPHSSISKKAPFARVIFCHAISGNSEVALCVCYKLQGIKPKGLLLLLYEVGRTEALLFTNRKACNGCSVWKSSSL